MTPAERARHQRMMALALEEARKAGARGEVPVGAVLALGDRVVAAAGNTREERQDALGHAELEVIHAGCRALGRWRLAGCTLYVTLEPCPMCAGACVNARLDRVVYGAADPQAGCLGSRMNLFALDLAARPRIVPGILEEECARLLRDFFETRRRDAQPPEGELPPPAKEDKQ